MKWLISFQAGLRALFRKQRVADEIDEEIASYLEVSTAHKASLGMSPQDARRAALIEMGSSHAVRQHVFDSHWESAIDNLLQDLRLSMRFLRRRPGFTFVALFSLTLGIGANVAIFTLVRQVLLQELPVSDPKALVTFGESENGGVGGGIDIGQFGLFPWYFAQQLELAPGPFRGIAAFSSFSNKVSVRRLPSEGSLDSSTTAPVLASANIVSGAYFEVLGSHALLGRTIVPSDATSPGSKAVAVLSYSFWQRSFLSDPSVIGQTLVLNNTPFTVVGVMPKAFQGIKLELEPVDLWAPVTMQPVVFQQPSLLAPHSALYFLHMFGRLAQGAADGSPAWRRSQAWLNGQIHGAVRGYEGSSVNSSRVREIEREIVPLRAASHGVSAIRAQYGNALWILMAVVALILLIACANLANLLLARAAGGEREVATRLALGSSRARIVRQSLIECLLLSLGGALSGLVLAFFSTRALIAFIGRGNRIPILNPLPDIDVLLFTLALTLLTALVFGLAPALIASRSKRSLAARFSARSPGDSGSTRFWPKAFVTLQIVISLVLLIGAGLFIRTLRNLQEQNFGFERNHLVVAQVNARLAGYKPSQTSLLYQRLIENLSTLAGVRSVALAASPPINPGGWSSSVTIPGYNPAPKENMVSVLNRVSGRYFQAVGIPIVAGRAITDEDSLRTLKVAVVNQALAKHFFPKGDAIGRSLSLDIDSARGPWQIVGIARDTRSNDPRTTTPIRMTYIPLAQIEPLLPNAASQRASATVPEENQDRFVDFVLIRTAGDVSSTIASLRAALRAADPNLPLVNVTTVQQQISDFISHDQLISSLTGLFSILALLLASIGLYGVMSYNVERRRGEFGIRIAVGAEISDVRGMVLVESMRLLAIGLLLGLPVAFAGAALLKHELFGLSAVDPATFAASIAVVAGMTVLASWIPARRAGKVDPIVALRAE